MNRKRISYLLRYSFAPLLGGALIYLLWRSDSLLLFRWLDVIGLSDWATAARQGVGISPAALPGWVRYSLPDGLWVFAATNALGALWLDDWRAESALWVFLPLLLACLAEIAQATQHIGGTFSAIDLVAYFAGGFLGWGTTLVHRTGETRQ